MTNSKLENYNTENNNKEISNKYRKFFYYF